MNSAAGRLRHVRCSEWLAVYLFEDAETMDYAQFLDRKAQLDGNHGFSPVSMPSWLFDFQAELVEWALLKGRAAVFADCGLGETAIELVWADNVVQRTGGRVLLLTPLAVTHQIAKDAEKFGIEAKVSRNGVPHAGITITNYEKLRLFDATQFVGVVCDESSILKSYSGLRRVLIS